LYLLYYKTNKGDHMNKHLHMIFAVALFTTIAVEAAAPNEKTVFVTKASFNSNLGGLTGADDKCQAEADSPASIVPPGTYMAWLSDGTDSPDTRFTKSSHSYMLPDGTKIAEDFTDLTDGSLLHAINIDPTGKGLGQKIFWTGTNADGTAAPQSVTCTGWNADPQSWHKGMHGQTNLTTSSWSIMHAAHECRSRIRLLCFQQ
jgi:hypothetical protein